MNLDRQIKRHLLAAGHRALVKPGPGCTPAVEDELRELLGTLATPDGARSSLRRGPDGVLLAPIRYRPLLEVAMRLATAQDISLLIGERPVHNRQILAALFESIHWEFFLREGDRVHLRCDSRASALYHEGIISEVAAARLERSRARIVKGDNDDGAVSVEVRIEHNRCSVLVSLAGSPLWKRGYRASTYAPAPLREDLAQSAIRTTLGEAERRRRGRDAPETRRWEPDSLFVPFSGSGTLLFEYLIDRFRIPPFVFRESYAFERFAVPPPPSVAWAKGKLLESLESKVSSAAPLAVQLVERDGRAVAAAKENLLRFESLLGAARTRPMKLPLRVESFEADVFTRPWRSWLPAGAHRVFLPMNPPYGLRLAARSTEELYRRAGAATAELAAALPHGGLRGFVLCPSEPSWKAFLGAARRLDLSTSHFSQGGLDIRLCGFSS